MCPYPEPYQSLPHHLILSLQDSSQYYPSTSVLVLRVGSFPMVFPPITYTRSSSHHSCYMPHPSHPLQLEYLLILVEEYKSRSSSLNSFLYPSVTSFLFYPNILTIALFSHTVSACSSLITPCSPMKVNRRFGGRYFQ
jgi:hypothetical protein